jgi:predicted transcriptional regulator
MKHLKRQARAIVSDLVEKHCVPCTKQAELRIKDGSQFGRDYCNVKCAIGRDLKKLGEYLDTKGDKTVKVKVMKISATKENCQDLLAKGTKNKDIADMFGISLANFYIKKKEWGLTATKNFEKKKDSLEQIKDIRKKVAVDFVTNKSFGEHLDDFVAGEEKPQPDYSREIEKYETEIAGLRTSNQLLSEKLRELETPQEINREMYQENAELKQNLKEKENVILGLFDDYKVLQRKYDALTTYTKEIM